METSILVLITLFCMHKSRGEVWDPWTINSDDNVAVVNAQKLRWGLRHIETCNSGAKVAVLNAKNHRSGLGPIEIDNSGPKVGFLHAKTTNEACDL